jgi:hypothetical protein
MTHLTVQAHQLHKRFYTSTTYHDFILHILHTRFVTHHVPHTMWKHIMYNAYYAHTDITTHITHRICPIPHLKTVPGLLTWSPWGMRGWLRPSVTDWCNPSQMQSRTGQPRHSHQVLCLRLAVLGSQLTLMVPQWKDRAPVQPWLSWV